jgi:diguanylate cyclase (GGDEF)-like protein
MSSPSRSGATSRPIPLRMLRGAVVACLGLTAIHSFRLLGDASETAMGLLTLVAVGSFVVGVRRNRPARPGPWILFIPSALLFAAGAIVREGVGSTGDLTSRRSIVPELFSFPGYICLIVALLWLLKLRAQQQHQPGVAADAMLLALGTFVASWTYLIDPVFSSRQAAPIAIVAVSVYPMISAYSVSMAARLAYGPGDRNLSHRLLVAGMAALVVGDVLWFLVDTGVIAPPGKLVDLPYGLTYTLISAAALHPSMRDVAHPLTSQRGHLQRSRVALVALSLLTPALVLPFWSPSNLLERILVPCLLGCMVSVAIARLVSAAQAQSRSEARFAHLATHDQLTGLPNRLLVYEFIESAVRAAPGGRQVAVVFLDIDRFRLVNDSLGHLTGDRLLRAVAARLQLVTRPGDLVSRISGDEFLVVALDTDAEGAAALGERMRAAFERPLDIGNEHHITVSAGVAWAFASPGGAWAADLTRDADTAMYRSKDRGGNAVTVFGEVMRDEVARRLAIESELRRALDEGELEVHYQPIVSLSTGAIEGFEALARWRRGEEWVPPVEFIPVAEESGLIIPLGAWVMTEACQQLARWRRLTGCGNLTMSVNVSPRQLRTSDVAAMVRTALHDGGLDGPALWFEITESSMMLDTSDTVATLKALHDMGVHVSVDDFGTGFSSLSYLQKFAVDRLKIDRSFVVAMEEGDESKSLVSAILAIARTLDIDVVAEGIETTEQAEALLALGCRGAQGYLFGRPSPAGTIEAMLAGQSELERPRSVQPSAVGTDRSA